MMEDSKKYLHFGLKENISNIITTQVIDGKLSTDPEQNFTQRSRKNRSQAEYNFVYDIQKIKQSGCYYSFPYDLDVMNGYSKKVEKKFLGITYNTWESIPVENIYSAIVIETKTRLEDGLLYIEYLDRESKLCEVELYYQSYCQDPILLSSVTEINFNKALELINFIPVDGEYLTWIDYWCHINQNKVTFMTGYDMSRR